MAESNEQPPIEVETEDRPPSDEEKEVLAQLYDEDGNPRSASELAQQKTTPS